MRVTCGPDPVNSAIWLVKPSGRLDAHGGTTFQDTVAGKLRPDACRLLVDMSKVEFLSSAGVTVLVRLLTECRRLGGAMSLADCPSHVLTTLKVTTIDRILLVRDTIEDSREALLESLA